MSDSDKPLDFNINNDDYVNISESQERKDKTPIKSEGSSRNNRTEESFQNSFSQGTGTNFLHRASKDTKVGASSPSEGPSEYPSKGSQALSRHLKIHVVQDQRSSKPRSQGRRLQQAKPVVIDSSQLIPQNHSRSTANKSRFTQMRKSTQSSQFYNTGVLSQKLSTLKTSKVVSQQTSADATIKHSVPTSQVKVDVVMKPKDQTVNKTVFTRVVPSSVRDPDDSKDTFADAVQRNQPSNFQLQMMKATEEAAKKSKFETPASSILEAGNANYGSYKKGTSPFSNQSRSQQRSSVKQITKHKFDLLAMKEEPVQGSNSESLNYDNNDESTFKPDPLTAFTTVFNNTNFNQKSSSISSNASLASDLLQNRLKMIETARLYRRGQQKILQQYKKHFKSVGAFKRNSIAYQAAAPRHAPESTPSANSTLNLMKDHSMNYPEMSQMFFTKSDSRKKPLEYTPDYFYTGVVAKEMDKQQNYSSDFNGSFYSQKPQRAETATGGRIKFAFMSTTDVTKKGRSGQSNRKVKVLSSSTKRRGSAIALGQREPSLISSHGSSLLDMTQQPDLKKTQEFLKRQQRAIKKSIREGSPQQDNYFTSFDSKIKELKQSLKQVSNEINQNKHPQKSTKMNLIDSGKVMSTQTAKQTPEMIAETAKKMTTSLLNDKLFTISALKKAHALVEKRNSSCKTGHKQSQNEPIYESILDKVYPEGLDGSAQFHYFINKTYYEQKVDQNQSVFDVCKINEKGSDTHSLHSSAENLVTQNRVVMPATTVLINKGDPKTSEEVQLVTHWLQKNTKHFGRMPKKLLSLIAQIVYSAPTNLGGGVYNKGDLIMPGGHRPKNIFIVFDGCVKKSKSKRPIEKSDPITINQTSTNLSGFKPKVQVSGEHEVESQHEMRINKKDSDMMLSSEQSITIPLGRHKNVSFTHSDQETTLNKETEDDPLRTQNSIIDEFELLQKGAVFGQKETKKRTHTRHDYRCYSDQCKILCVSSIDYSMAYEKYLIQEKASNVRFLTKIPTFEFWSQNKLENLCSNFRIKSFRQGDTVMEAGDELRDLIFVRNGTLKIDKQISIEKKNFWPSSVNRNAYDLESKFTWDESKQVVNLEMTIMNIPQGSYFGLFEIQKDQPFKQGKLLVSSESVTLLYIKKSTFLEIMTPKEVHEMSLNKQRCVIYPDDNEVRVKIEAEHKYARMRQNHLLNAANCNPVNESQRDYDFKQASASPNKSMQKWLQIFNGNRSRSSSVLRSKSQESQRSPAKRRSKIPANQGTTYGELIAGSKNWQKQMNNTFSPQERRVSTIQRKLKKAIEMCGSPSESTIEEQEQPIVITNPKKPALKKNKTRQLSIVSNSNHQAEVFGARGIDISDQQAIIQDLKQRQPDLAFIKGLGSPSNGTMVLGTKDNISFNKPIPVQTLRFNHPQLKTFQQHSKLNIPQFKKNSDKVERFFDQVAAHVVKKVAQPLSNASNVKVAELLKDKKGTQETQETMELVE